MKRLKTFLTYLLLIVGFFLVSRFLEYALIKDMYYDMTGNVKGDFIYNSQNVFIDINVLEAKSTRVNGYVNMKIFNASDTDIELAYLKVDLYSKSGVLGISKYMEVNNLKAGETRDYTLRFEGKYIKTYDISMQNEFPDKDYIFNFFGYEINTRDIFGLDLSKYINAKTIKDFGRSVWYNFTVTVKNIPWWGWMGAWMIIVGVW